MGIGGILSSWYHDCTLVTQFEDDVVAGTAVTPGAAATGTNDRTATAATTTTALAPASYLSRKVLVSSTE
ncbi:hypothetical protein H9P43_008821 [Blastocladiella emersonii ATCC 22665]|nr:hypothetical protein H9P43_008821 [Blastocladiella emersonii ATCC 22665]